jgi:hypothetical protein
MPKMVHIELDPAYKRDATATAAAKKEGRLLVTYQTALENVRLSGGLYRIAPDENPVVAPKVQAIEDMDRSSLLALAVSLGMKTEKQMTVAGLAAFVKGKLDAVEIIE